MLGIAISHGNRAHIGRQLSTLSHNGKSKIFSAFTLLGILVREYYLLVSNVEETVQGSFSPSSPSQTTAIIECEERARSHARLLGRRRT